MSHGASCLPASKSSQSPTRLYVLAPDHPTSTWTIHRSPAAEDQWSLFTHPSSGLAGWLAAWCIVCHTTVGSAWTVAPPHSSVGRSHSLLSWCHTFCIDRCIGGASIPAPRVNDSSLHSLQRLTALGDCDDQLY